MKKFIDRFYKNQSLVSKIFLFILTLIVVVYLFPKGGKFKYDVQKGKPWQYENLYAPFNFILKKSALELEKEREAVIKQAIPYFDFDSEVVERVLQDFNRNFDFKFNDSLGSASLAKTYGEVLIKNIYNKGVLENDEIIIKDKQVYLKKGNEVLEQPVFMSSFLNVSQIPEYISNSIARTSYFQLEGFYKGLIPDIIKPNVFLNKFLTNTVMETHLSTIALNRGIIEKGTLIISKGEVVEGSKFQTLNSLKAVFASQVWSESNYYWIVLGYSMLVALALLMLYLFLRKYRPEIYNDTTKITFICFNIVLMVLLTTLIVKYNANYLYIVPICVSPLILKAFFDPRLGLFVHVLTVLILGFIVPNSFEYMFLQIIAGIVTILTVSELYKRANLFISVSQITLVYIVGFFAFYIIHEGNISGIDWETFVYFIICGLLTLFSHPLIYFYEKLFGLVSDVSLLELSDTNSKLLKELSDKAPGTFHHSLNVANLAESAANEINANAMLVRVGALYHDIGKMNNPLYFVENQATSVNPHNELAPKESAKIIIDHVIEGIEIAKKNKLPDRVIDFIRTHHGTSLVYYFYKKQLDGGEAVNEIDFKYQGPKPFSKETAILMMADSVEAASKSLKEPNYTLIDSFVENIINKQMEQGQFLNSNITFKEIELIKKVLKKKLTNIYHIRIEYPE